MNPSDKQKSVSSPLSIIPRDEVTSYDVRPSFEVRQRKKVETRIKRVAQRCLRVVIGIVGFATRTPRRGPELRAGSAEVQRILVVRVDLLGDVVLSLPAVRALRRAYPSARIDMLVLGSSAGILAGETDLDHVLSFDPYIWRSPLALGNPKTWRNIRTFLSTLRAARYDLAISVSGDIGSILTRLSGARRRVGYGGEAYKFMLTDVLPGGRYRKRQHETQYVLALAQAAGGVVVPGDEHLHLNVVPLASAHVMELLRQGRARLSVEGPVIAIHAGARNGQAKRWPHTYFSALIDLLVRDLDALVVLTGAPGEAPLAHAVESGAREHVLNLVGKTNLPELVALIAASDLLITGDSGPMHIACAVKTPVVALHGPTDPALSGPTASDAVVLRRDLWCSPCYDASATAECRFGNPVCMKGIAPAMVFAAARRQLRRNGWELPAQARDDVHAISAPHS